MARHANAALRGLSPSGPCYRQDEAGPGAGCVPRIVATVWPSQELASLAGLRALNVAMVGGCSLVPWALRGEDLRPCARPPGGLGLARPETVADAAETAKDGRMVVIDAVSDG